jgi:hypothetical protein
LDPSPLRHMKKDEQNPVFEVWLAAFQSRLVEVARVCAPSAQDSVSKDEKAVTEPETPPSKNS